MKNWHSLTIEEIEAFLKSQKQKYGPNRLAEATVVAWHDMIWRQFASPLIIILVFAAVISFFIGDKIDAIAIFSIIVLNAALGFAQEWKAETTLKSLKKMLAPRCRVVRDGKTEEIDAETLVPGDRVLLSAGNAVPADIRLYSVVDLKTDESVLTGESNQVEKYVKILSKDTAITDKSNMAWMGTYIVNGRGIGIVVATGMDTEFGRIAGLTGGIKDAQTHLQKHLAYLAKQLGWLALLVSFAVAVVGIWGGKDKVEMVMTAVSLAVAAVPEGLPAVVTITLALGAGIMARKKALLRSLQAAETLGAVSVICTDKTGTLTKNQMTVRRIWTYGAEFDVEGVGYIPEGKFLKDNHSVEPELYSDLIALLDTARKCNNASIEQYEEDWRAIGAPTEAALLVAAEKAGLKQAHGAVIIAENAFNSIRKRMSVVEETDVGLMSHVKGAPEEILRYCTHILSNGCEVAITDQIIMEINSAWEVMAKGGMRTLALARRVLENDCELSEECIENKLVFLGVVGVIDPPREEVVDALEKAYSSGIKVIVITGDSANTAVAIAEQIGLKVDKVLTSQDIEKLSDRELSSILKEKVLFARTVPEDKFRIVKLLQEQGHLTAMTGDGVNDAPALKQANIGIAMGVRGTDVAKGAADIVLTDDNFASIIAAIEEGRRQFSNICKFVQFLIAHNIGEVVAIFTNILMGGPLILIPVQILWLNLVTDGVTALALSVEKAENNIMNEPPRALNKEIIDKKTMAVLAAFGVYIGLSTLFLFQAYLDASYALANTIALTALVISAQVLVLNFRNVHGSMFSIGWFSNRWLLAAIAAMIGLQIAAVYTPVFQRFLNTVPLSAIDWLVVSVVVLPIFIVTELYKVFRSF